MLNLIQYLEIPKQTRDDKNMPRAKKTKQPEEPNFDKFYSSENPTARRWMWIGVFSFSAIIILLWGISLQTSISLINWGNSAEGNLISKTKSSLDQAFADRQKQKEQTQTAKEQIAMVISKIIANAASASSSNSFVTSSTPLTTTAIIKFPAAKLKE